jgi:hypothetical protein
MESTENQIWDVVILGIMPLGEFTPEEFNAAPPGMEARPVPLEELIGQAN